MQRPIRNALFAATVVIGASLGAVASDKDTPAGNDAHALAVVATVDKDEIAAAKQAQGKQMSTGAMDYARMLERDHQMNLDQIKAMGRKDDKAMKSPDAKALHEKNAATLERLAPLNGAEYEQAYLDAMAKGHAEVLAKLDNELLPKAKDAAVKDHLTKTRTAVEGHLEQAKSLQAKP